MAASKTPSASLSAVDIASSPAVFYGADNPHAPPPLYVVHHDPHKPNPQPLLLNPSLPIVPPVTESPKPTDFRLPDLVGHCKFTLDNNPHSIKNAPETVKWMSTNCNFKADDPRMEALEGLKAGELTGHCYPKANIGRLRVISDFLAYLFHLDDISDGMITKDTDALSDAVMNALYFPEKCFGKLDEMNAGKMARDFWGRAIKDAGPGCQARFKETFELFFDAVNIQTKARYAGETLTLERYIDIRRDTSGCKPCWALIEYGLEIDLPYEIVNHPVIAALDQCTNDLVTWSNDIFSYNKEQSQGDTHNMIVILMQHHGYNLQQAVDYVGKLCSDTIDNFIENRKMIPTWKKIPTPTTDSQSQTQDNDKKSDTDGEIDPVNTLVKDYVDGLQDWIIGSLDWSFKTTRYFDGDGLNVKKTREVKLLSPQKKTS